jgi:Tol biopolymer transport system component
MWSPDGSRVGFDSNRNGRYDLCLKASNGAGSEELLLESTQDKIPIDWSHDGRFLMYLVNDPQASWDIWALPMEGDRKSFVFLKTNFNEGFPQFSRDGRWVAYHSNESERFEIYVRPFSGSSSSGESSGSGGGGQWQVSTTGGTYPRWRFDGKELYYIAPDGKLMSAPVATSGAAFQPGTPVALFQTRIVGSGAEPAGPQYDVFRDGRFLINTVLDEVNSPITLLQNWNPETKK